MKLPVLKGSPKQVQWATKIRTECFRVWREASPQRFGEIEEAVAAMREAGWWISYRDKDITTVYNHLSEGIDLQKIQRDEWRKQEKKQELQESAEARRYLKKELQKEAGGRESAVSGLTLRNSSDDILMKWEGQALDMRTGEPSRDPDLPF